MKVGDLVRLKTVSENQKPTRVGVLIDLIQKKCWPRLMRLGAEITWDDIEPQAHGVVLYDDCSLSIPVGDIEKVEC